MGHLGVGFMFGSAFLNFALARFASFGSFAWSEIKVIWGVEEELRKLERTFFKIQELVGVIDGCPLRFYGGSNAWQLWFEDMLKLAYDADALLDQVGLLISDHCAKHSNQEQQQQQRQVFSMIRSSPSNINIPHAISKMQKKLDALAKEIESLVMIEKIKFDARIPTSGKSLPFPLSSLHNSFTSMVGVGRENDKRRIVDLLGKVGSETSSNFSVISVTGMGGIGKTAIARHVYDDDNVRGDFNLRVWVSVSVQFDVIRITKSMIEFGTKGCNVCHLSDLESLQSTLEGLLCGRKFLLVLDDYWSEKCEDWDTLSWPFRVGYPGSKVIVTTRSTKVSSVVCSSHAYKLEILSDDDCWEVIKQRSFVSVESSNNLESVGRQIAQKCKGIPLVATTLGNMLRCSAEEEEWRLVLKNELWDDTMFLRLIQSYIHLPPHLQKCFAYCSIFPQGHEFEEDELAFLWVAEGYVNVQPTSQGDQTLEDLARGYMKDLCLRFVFEQYEKSEGGRSEQSPENRKTYYKMHDLMHALSRLVSKDICFHGKLNNSYPLFGDACHLSLLHDSKQSLTLKASVKNERLRTFLLMSNDQVAHTILHAQLFSHLKFLRVLGLGGAGLRELVGSIGQLKYLRYLNLCDNFMYCLPKSMCELKALQTLKLRKCPNLRDLPNDMSNLINLRHLDIDIQSMRFACMPPHFGKLTNLQSLSAYIVGEKKNGYGIGELKSMNCLRGSLCITNINYVASASDAAEANLGLKTRLDKLELQWESTAAGDMINQQQQAAVVLGALKPHTNLKELVIRNYCGVTYPTWLSDSSRTLTSIDLKGLKNCNHLPSLGELPFLSSFVITDMPRLEMVGHKFYGKRNAVLKFPSLKRFELRDLSNLAHWKSDDESCTNAMPHLEKFTIHDCDRLSILPPNIQKLLSKSNIANCPKLQPLFILSTEQSASSSNSS